MWIPPLTSTGSSVITPAKNNVPHDVYARSAFPRMTSRIPVTTPTRGKKHMAYFIFLSFHSTRGIGIFEYIETPIARDSKNLILTPRIVRSLLFQMWSSPGKPKAPSPESESLPLRRSLLPDSYYKSKAGKAPMPPTA